MGSTAAILLVTSGDISETLPASFSRSGLPTLHAGDVGAADALPLRFASRSLLEADVADILRAHGRPAAIALAATGRGSLTPTPVHQLTDDDWEAAVQRPLREGLFTYQALHALFPENPPPIFQIGPTLGLTGAAELVALSALTEGQRALAKVAARQWGKAGWRVNWLGLSPEIYSPRLAQAQAPKLPDMSGPALGRRPGLADLAALIALLSQPQAGILTGSTLSLDGGDWMLP